MGAGVTQPAVDPRAMLDAYAVGHEIDVNGESIDREDHAPAAFAALRAVLHRHAPMQFGDEHNQDEFPDPTVRWCKECTLDRFHRQRWPCPTVQDITTALKTP